MDSSSSHALPAWIRKRDGRIEPFDAERINRDLFAATESLGQADAFVARELADSVLHFLAAENESSTMTSDQVAETLVKVVRELGQVQLALAYQTQRDERRQTGQADAAGRASPLEPTAHQMRGWLDGGLAPFEVLRRAGAASLAAFGMREVFSRSIAAACHEGLLAIERPDCLIELAAAVCRPLTPGARGLGVLEAVRQARTYVGGTLAIDSPERDLARGSGRIGEASLFIRELHWAASALGLGAVLNLGAHGDSGDWADEGPGPLFAEQWRPDSSERVLGFLEVLLDQALSSPSLAPLRLDWHLGADDCYEPESRKRLLRLVRAALRGLPIRFVFDRPRRRIALGDGLDRQTPAVLIWIVLKLPALAKRVGPRLDVRSFAAKVVSLARLAASAGVQKRDFMRRHGQPDRPPFIVETAAIGLRLEGAREALASLSTNEPVDEATSWSMLQELIQSVGDGLRGESQRLHLKLGLEDILLPAYWDQSADHGLEFLRAAGRCHAAIGHGTVLLPLTKQTPLDPDTAIELLHTAWKHSGVCCLAFVRPEEQARQLTVYPSEP